MFNNLITLPQFLTAGLGWKSWLLPIILSAILVVTGIYDFLVFHILAEMFAIAIAVVLVLVVWNTYSYSKNHFLMYLGVGYFWLATIDLLHSLSYKGMGLLPINESNVSIQLWVVARFLQAVLLLSAPYFLTRTVHRVKVFSLFGMVSITASILVFNGYFPTAFIEGEGLTDFKIYAEYIIIAILAASIVSLTRKRSFIDFNIYNLMVLTIVVTMISELAFTFYVSVYGLSNLVGHIFKLLSFWLVYQAIIQTTLREPFSVMARGASTYNAIPDSAVVVNSEGTILQTNRAACEQAGLDESELVNQHFYRLFSLDRNELPHECDICEQIKLGKELKNIEYRVPKTDSWFRYSLTPLKINSSSGGMVLVVSDITARKNAEKSVVEKEKLLRTLLDTIPDLIWLKDKEGRYIICNANFEKLYGVTEEGLVGKKDYDFIEKKQADFFRSKDLLAMVSEKPVSNEEWLTFASDGHKALFETTKTPMMNSDNKSIGVLGIARDITERHESVSERDQLHKELQQSQKMESLGKLTGGIAHDFNNILGVIVGYSGLLKNSLLANPELEKYATHIELAGKRGAKLTKKLLGFSRKKASNQSVINLNDLLTEDYHLLEKSLTAKINLELRLSDNLSPVLIDGYDFEDAILNICINSMHAMPDGGDLTIQSRNIELDGGEQNPHELLDGKYVLISISDTGLGMDDDTKDRLFEPFYSTKGDKGTGLGLSQVYGFVQRTKGEVHVDSEINKGTTFGLYFPVYTGQEKPVATEIVNNVPDIERLSGSKVVSESILVVDDEGSLRELARDILMLKGYRVVCAKDGEDALSILENDRFDLMISDVVMPGMNGYQLAVAVREKYPNTKIQMVSGFSGFDDDRKYIEDSDELYIKILRKPVSTDQLLSRVSSIFASNNTPPSKDNAIESALSSSDAQEFLSGKIVKWSDDIAVGIDAIDSDHKVLIELLNKSRLDEDGGNSSSDKVLKILEELSLYAKHHFGREEKIMEVCNYPSFRKHRRVHQYMLQEIANKVNRYRDGVLTQEALHDFLSDWLINHIKGMDKMITPYAEEKEELISSVIDN